MGLNREAGAALARQQIHEKERRGERGGEEGDVKKECESSFRVDYVKKRGKNVRQEERGEKQA